MLFKYICPECKNTETLNISSSEVKDKVVICSKCGKTMRRDWKASVFVADSDKSSNIEETSYLNSIMNIRPSGKTRSIY